jgi:hypothetical protein
MALSRLPADRIDRCAPSFSRIINVRSKKWDQAEWGRAWNTPCDLRFPIPVLAVLKPEESAGRLRIRILPQDLHAFCEHILPKVASLVADHKKAVRLRKENIMNELTDVAKAGGKRMTTFGVIAIILGVLAMLAPVVTGLSIALLLGIPAASSGSSGPSKLAASAGDCSWSRLAG